MLLTTGRQGILLFTSEHVSKSLLFTLIAGTDTSATHREYTGNAPGASYPVVTHGGMHSGTQREHKTKALETPAKTHGEMLEVRHWERTVQRSSKRKGTHSECTGNVGGNSPGIYGRTQGVAHNRTNGDVWLKDEEHKETHGNTWRNK